jgi:hypothetical protein
MGASSRCRGALLAGILLASAGALRLPAQATLRGILYDDVSGARLRGTVMLVDPSTDAAVVHVATDTLGQFSMLVPRGTFQIGAVRPGYKSVLSAPMSLVPGERLTVRIPIAEQGDPTHPIGVLEHVRPEEKPDERSYISTTGFEHRRRTGLGQQFDRGQLLRSQRRTLGDFLRTVSGFQVGDPSSTSSMFMSRNQGMMAAGQLNGARCQVAWFVDGHRMDLPGRFDSMTEGLGMMSIDAIEAVEVFRGLSEMPAEFADPDVRCGAVAIWTRRG